MILSTTRRRIFWILALTVVAVSTPLTGLLYSYSSRSLTEKNGSGDKAASSRGEVVVCFGQVDLEHGVTALYPVQPGRVVEVLVQEGQTVSEGAVLLRLEDGVSRSRVAEAQAALDEAELRLAQARKSPEQHRSRVSQQQDSVEAMRRRLSAAQHQLARQKDLAKKDLVDTRDLAVSEDHVHELEALLRAEQSRLSDLNKQDPADDAQRAEKEVAVMRARRDQARFGLEECVIKAPRRGSVLRLLAGPGDVLASQAKQPAIQFAIDGPQVVRAEVEQEFVSRLAVGQSTIVEDESNEANTWRGKVARVSNWITQRRSIMQEPFQFTDVRTVETLITLEPGQQPLRIGQRVRVRIGAGSTP
jgi:multidrug resistance efflux pump